MEAFYRDLVAGHRTGVGHAVLRSLLTGVSLPYRGLVAVRNRLYDAGMLPVAHAPVPVVSIGNITLGGTGKTPFVELVSRWFSERGKRVVILSRGYRSAAGPNDEARLLATNLPGVPHLQGRDRVALAAQAVGRLNADVLVLDDGFQHRRLARDLDIVLVDATNPFGHGRLFPRGLLREPIASLRRADIIVLTRANLCSPLERARLRHRVAELVGDTPVLLAEHRPTRLRRHDGVLVAASQLRGKPVAAFCGIGNPAAFEKTLANAGCLVTDCRIFPDHHPYTAADAESLARWVRDLRPYLVVTTQKDLVKLARTELGSRPLYALEIELAITESTDRLQQALNRLVEGTPGLSRAA